MKREDKRLTSFEEDFPTSYWRDSVDLRTYPALHEDLHVDVAVVGAGITGITAAYLLQKAGKSVALLEADWVLNGTTGHTTAKITAQHGLIYDELLSTVGKKQARLYFEANRDALTFIEDLVSEHEMQCDFSKQDSYVYATTATSEENINKEAKAYETLGIDGELLYSLPIDIDVRNALVMPNQAQFHPVAYLRAVLDAFTRAGGQVFEQTVAVNVETGEQPTVLTKDNQRVSCQQVLICTHFPFYEGRGLYSTRMYADRSYVVAARTKEPYPGGMYLSADSPTRSLRSVSVDGEDLVLLIGEGHKTGQAEDVAKRYETLKQFGDDVFGVTSVPYHWSAQDLTTLDQIPYVGELTKGESDVLVATGFRKWGMTNGTAAALLLHDLVLDKENRYQALYKPTRFSPRPSIQNFLKENINVGAQLLKGKLSQQKTDVDQLKKDEGAVVNIKGERKGAYRDKEGKLHIVDTTCTHIGCEVGWNNAERSWDCPCHGSRFTYTGEVIEGPAEKPLQTYDYKMLDNLTSDDSGY